MSFEHSCIFFITSQFDMDESWQLSQIKGKVIIKIKDEAFLLILNCYLKVIAEILTIKIRWASLQTLPYSFARKGVITNNSIKLYILLIA